MRTHRYLLAVAFLLAGIAHAAAPPEVKTAYDRFKDATTVTLSPDIGPLPDHMGFALFTFFKGRQVTRPDIVLITFWSSHKEWEYLKCHSVSALLDDAPFKLAESRHDGTVGSGYVIERVSVTLPFDDLARMSLGKTVEFKICNTEFVLNDGIREKLREFVAVFPAADVRH